MTYETTVTRTREVQGVECDVEINVVVTYRIIPGSRGMRDSLGGIRGAGPALEPDEAPEVEIVRTVESATGKDIDLGDEEMEAMQNAIIDEQ